MRVASCKQQTSLNKRLKEGGEKVLTVSDRAKREHVLKRLKSTKHNETICLAGWEVEILLLWIEELKAKGEKTE